MALRCMDVPGLPGLGTIRLRGGSSAADDLAVPLFEQPYSLPMVKVTEAIGRAIILAEHTGSEPLDAAALANSADLLEAWIACQGNQSAMAEALGCHRNTVRNRMNQLTGLLPNQTDPADHFKTLLLAHLLLKP